MFGFKFYLVFVVLTLYNVEAEIEEKDGGQDVSTTSLPVALELSESKKNGIPQSIIEKTTEIPEDQVIDISNDIEVLKETNGPQKENQDETAMEVETTPDAEQPNKEETEAGSVTEVEVEDKAPPQPEDEAALPAEVETAMEPDSDNKAPAEIETNNETEAAVEEEKENTQPIEEANKEDASAGTDKAEMPNDEPAKEEEYAQPALTNQLHDQDLNNKAFTCLTCNSNEDSKCALKSTKQMPCPKASEGDAGKHNGCYTLLQADTNITMRGCVDDLAEGGLKYCLTNEKLCNLCYINNCNDKQAPSSATKLQFNVRTVLILNISSLILIKLATLKYN